MVKKRIKSLLKGREASFLLKFFAIFALLYFIISFANLEFLTNSIASLQSTELNSIGINTIQAGSSFSTQNFNVKIVSECTGLTLIALLLALFYASGMIVKKNVPYIIAAGIFLLIFNQVRLFATIALGNSLGVQAFDLIHAFLWFVDSGVVLALWYYKL